MPSETELKIKITTDAPTIKTSKARIEELLAALKIIEFRQRDGKISTDAYTKAVSGLTTEFNKLQVSIGQSARVQSALSLSQQRVSVGHKGMATSLDNIQKASQQSRTALLSVSQAIQDAPYGIRGMSNNIEFLAQQFLVLRTTAGGTGAALKQMFTGLGSASGVLIGFSAVSALINYFYGAQKSVKGLADELKALNELKLDLGFIKYNDFVKQLTIDLDNLKKAAIDPTFFEGLKYAMEGYGGVLKGMDSEQRREFIRKGGLRGGGKVTPEEEKGILEAQQYLEYQLILKNVKLEETRMQAKNKSLDLTKEDYLGLNKILKAAEDGTKVQALKNLLVVEQLKNLKSIEALEKKDTDKKTKDKKAQETETEQYRENLLVAEQILLNSEKLKSKQAYLLVIEKKIEDKKFQGIISSKELMNLHLKDGKISEQELELQRELESLLSEQQATKKAIITDAENLNKLTYNAFVEAEQFKNKDKLLTNQEQIDQNKLFITKAEELGLTKEQIKLLQENLKLNVQITQDQLSINKEKYDGLQNEIDQKYISKELTNQQYIFELKKLLVIAEQNGLLNEARRIRMKIAQVAQKDDLGDLFKKGIKDSVLNGFDQMINKISFMNDKFNMAGISFKAFSEIMLTELSRIILKMIAMAAVEAVLTILNPIGAAAKAGTDLLSNSKGFASGGYINEPVVGMGRSGRMYSIAEKGSELIIPNNRLANNMNSSRGAGGGAMNVIVTGKLKGRDIYLSNVRESHQISRLSY